MACYYAYFGGRFEKRRVGVSGFEEVALYVVFAIPINAVAFLICRIIGLEFDINTVAHLVAGGGVTEQSIDRIAENLRAHVVLTTAVYLGIVMGSFAVGTLARRVVWTLRLDTRIPLMRLRHPWYYVFQGRDKKLPSHVLAYVDILVSLPDDDKSRLYRGLVTDFDMAPDGKLESIILRGALRGSGRGNEFKWVSIPSNHFVLMGNTIHSINVTYFSYEEKNVESMEPSTSSEPKPDAPEPGVGEGVNSGDSRS
jgi:hypothetical protein